MSKISIILRDCIGESTFAILKRFTYTSLGHGNAVLYCICVKQLYLSTLFVMNASIYTGRVAQSVGHLTRKSEVLSSIPVWPHTFVSPSADSRGAVVTYWRKYVQEVLVNRLGGLSLPRKSVVWLTDRPNMALDVYRGRKTTQQQQPFTYNLVVHLRINNVFHLFNLTISD